MWAFLFFVVLLVCFKLYRSFACIIWLPLCDFMVCVCAHMYVSHDFLVFPLLEFFFFLFFVLICFQKRAKARGWIGGYVGEDLGED